MQFIEISDKIRFNYLLFVENILRTFFDTMQIKLKNCNIQGYLKYSRN